MFFRISRFLLASLTVWLLLQNSLPQTFITTGAASVALVQQTGALRIAQRNPVVNEKRQLTLSVTDANGQPVTGVTWESGSPDIASVNPQTGVVQGVTRGFATITARRGADSISTFVSVARVLSASAAKVPGDTKVDNSGRFYISNPKDSVVLRKTGFSAPIDTFAGQAGATGLTNGDRRAARFNNPTAVSVDNTSDGGIVVADTLNHCIRKISFNDQVATMVGNGSPGRTPNDVTPIAEARLSSPRGLAVDSGGNLFVADTDNHAIYYVDFEKQMVRLLAGQPGTAGKADGQGRTARFTRPSGLALSTDGTILVVADEGNNVVRLVTRSGNVATLGKAMTARGVFENLSRSAATLAETDDQTAGEIQFKQPQSVGVDNLGNIYVVDAETVSVVTRPLDRLPQVVSLAQAGSFQQAASVYIEEHESYVLDANADSPTEAVKQVTFGAPSISSISPPNGRLSGGTDVVISGQNFAPDSVVILGDREAPAMVETATRIRFTVPPQTVPGNLTLSVQTRGGVAQQVFSIVAKPLAELAPKEITTVAGGVPYLGDGGEAGQASFNLGTIESEGAGGTVVDGFGNVLIADPQHHRIRRVDRSGIISTIAGNGRKGYSGDGGLALQASFDRPRRLALDNAGNLFIVDFGNDAIRRVDAMTGIVTTVAGRGDSLGDGGPATKAILYQPSDVLVDPNGNLLVADSGQDRVRKVDTQTGIITTIAGTGDRKFSGDNGPATAAGLAYPYSLALDAQGNLFISDRFNLRVRKVNSAGIITTVAGNGNPGDGNGTFGGDNGPATTASLSEPDGLAVDMQGNLLIADFHNHRVRKVDARSQIITTIVGTGSYDFFGDGGSAINAAIIQPAGLTLDGSGNLFIVDTGNNRIRRVTNDTGIIVTFAGGADSRFSGDGGPAVSATLYQPHELAVDSSGNLLIADAGNGRVRRVDAITGIITTVAGNGTACCEEKDGIPAVMASILNNYGLTVAPSGQSFFYSKPDAPSLVRRVTNGLVQTVAGSKKIELGDGGPATSAYLQGVTGLTLDNNGNLLIADTYNHRIRRVDAAGIITTLAGSGPTVEDMGDFSGDGGPATSARLNKPEAIVVDPAGNLFIGDTINFRVRRVDARTQTIRTYAGGGTDQAGDGGPATKAQLGTPRSLAIDAAGNLFIATSDQRVRRVDAVTGIITTVAGNMERGYSGDEKPATTATFTSAIGVAIDRQGNLYISDSADNVVRVVKGVGVGAPSDTQAPTVTGVTLSKKKVVRKKDASLGISWNSSDNTGVSTHDLSFAADGSNFSTTIVTGLSGSTRQFTWTVPSTVAKTQTGVVRVAAKDAAGNTGLGVSGGVSIK